MSRVREKCIQIISGRNMWWNFNTWHPMQFAVWKPGCNLHPRLLDMNACSWFIVKNYQLTAALHSVKIRPRGSLRAKWFFFALSLHSIESFFVSSSAPPPSPPSGTATWASPPPMVVSRPVSLLRGLLLPRLHHLSAQCTWTRSQQSRQLCLEGI